jgi:hypothetical protein
MKSILDTLYFCCKLSWWGAILLRYCSGCTSGRVCKGEWFSSKCTWNGCTATISITSSLERTYQISMRCYNNYTGINITEIKHTIQIRHKLAIVSVFKEYTYHTKWRGKIVRWLLLKFVLRRGRKLYLQIASSFPDDQNVNSKLVTQHK